MTPLTPAQRSALPNSAFAGPNRSFPVNDLAHAKAAMMLNGNAPVAAQPAIKAKAKKVLKSPHKGDLGPAIARMLAKRPAQMPVAMPSTGPAFPPFDPKNPANRIMP